MTAVSGLAARIATALDCKVNYGVVGKYLHWTLLWQRDVSGKRERLDYGNKSVPSWSWMAYPGAIKFFITPVASLDAFDGLEFHLTRKDCLNVELSDFWDCCIEKQDEEYKILDLQGRYIGEISYDTDVDIDHQRCVVVGRSGGFTRLRDYFIIVVASTSITEYERIGVGRISSLHVSRVGIRARLI
jgi:hypothetical protein